jgi:hypothetical protein
MSKLRDWIQFGATVVSPLILAWVGVVSTQIQNRVKEQRETQEKAIARQDQLQKEAFAASGTRFEHTQKIFADLLSQRPEQKRLAVLATLAFIEERQIPEFFLPVLAITESGDAEIASYLRQGLTELSLDETAPASMRNWATRALGLLISTNDVVNLQGGATNEVVRANVQTVNQVAASLTKESAAAEKPEEKQQVQKQLRELESALNVAQNYTATAAKQLAAKISNKVADLQPTLPASDIKPKIDDTLASAVETVKALPDVKDPKAAEQARQSLATTANQFKEVAVKNDDPAVAQKATDALRILGETAVQTKSSDVANAVSKSLEEVASQGKTPQIKGQARATKESIDSSKVSLVPASPTP